MRHLTVLCLLILLCSGCSQLSLLNAGDYQKSQQDFLTGDAAAALRDFPQKVEGGHIVEDGDFITTMEKGYLSLIQGQPDIAGLQRQAAALKNDVRYHVSPDGKTYFYARTPEDYYPAEHEIIWLHFLLSWGYSLQGKYPEGCNEAREARDLLSPGQNSPGNFDDPAMRIFLATLWTMCGDWREAQTDLRAAWAMDNALKWAKSLAEHDRPPSHLLVVLGGPGPTVSELTPPSNSGSEHQFGFDLRGRKSQISAADARGVAMVPHLSPDAGNWYERDIARTNELRGMLARSAYVSSAIEPIKGWSNLEAGAVLGVFAGAVVGSADAFTKGKPLVQFIGSTMQGMLAGAAIGATWGIIADYTGVAQIVWQPDRHTAERYRYVRYLPEYLWVAWTDQPIAYPLEIRTPHYLTVVRQPSVNNNSVAVSVAHIVDAK